MSLTAEMHRRGFDLTHAVPFERGVRLRCSQCEALSINGIPTHERGCPNVVPVCRECGNLDPDRVCCTPWEEES
jgi:hypothetical protein